MGWLLSVLLGELVAVRRRAVSYLGTQAQLWPLGRQAALWIRMRSPGDGSKVMAVGLAFR